MRAWPFRSSADLEFEISPAAKLYAPPGVSYLLLLRKASYG